MSSPSDYVSGGELFTHLYQRERFAENEVRTYIGEIVLALETLHKVMVWRSLAWSFTTIFLHKIEHAAKLKNDTNVKLPQISKYC